MPVFEKKYSLTVLLGHPGNGYLPLKYPPLKQSIPITFHASGLSSPSSRKLVIKNNPFKTLQRSFSLYLTFREDVPEVCFQAIFLILVFSELFPLNIKYW